MCFRLPFSFITVFLLFFSISAEVYFGNIFLYQQPDGSAISIKLWGDEYYARAETIDGYTITKDHKSGYFCYASLAKDGRSFISTGIRAGIGAPVGIEKGLTLKSEAVRDLVAKKRTLFGVDDRGRLLPEYRIKLRPSDYGYLRWTPDLDQRTNSFRAAPSSTTVGDRVGVVLLASFPDRQEDVVFTESQVDSLCNDSNYTSFGNATSVFGYYAIQSNGKLNYHCIVTSYFTAANNRSYYTDTEITFGVRAKELINEGLNNLQTLGFKFADCDGNNDGVIDGVNCFYAGDRVSSWSKGLWPHKWSSNWSGFSAYGFSTSFQYQITEMGTSVLKIGTFCHENGHMICDFPDLYSYDGCAASVGRYSLMGTSATTHPVNMDAYLKMHAGWANIIDLNSSSHQRCGLQTDKNTFYRYQNTANSKEFFLIEMRDNSGYEGIFGGSLYPVNPTRGVVVYHCKNDGSNTHSSIVTSANPTDYSKPYEVLVLEASPSTSYTPWYRDPTPGSDDALYSGGISAFSDFTSPALKFWSSTGRTVLSNMNIHSVSSKSSAMTFIIGSGSLTGSARIGLTEDSLVQSCYEDGVASSQIFAVFNAGAGTLNYTIADDQSWLSVSPVSGTAIANIDKITVSYNPTSVASGTHTATITVTDGSAANSPQIVEVIFTIIDTVNDAPVITAVASQSVKEDSCIVLRTSMLVYSDEEGDSVTILPAFGVNYTLNADTLTPDADFNGSINVGIRLFDYADTSASVNIAITVLPVNDAPIITPINDTNIYEDSIMNLQILASDIDANDSLRYTVSGVFGITVTAGGYISWIPDNSTVGSNTIFVTVTDDSSATVYDTFVVTVDNTNDSPTITPFSDTTATEDLLFTRICNTHDIDVGDQLTYTVSGHSSMTISSDGLISWTPQNADSGSHQIIVTVTDLSGVSVSDTFLLIVEAVNDSPVLSSVTTQSIPEDSLLEIILAMCDANDEEGDVLSLIIGNGSNYSVAGAVFTPDHDFFGVCTLFVRVTDGNTISETVSMIINVNAVNDAPVLNFVESQTINQYDSIDVLLSMINATDVDNDSLSLVIFDGTDYSINAMTIIPDSGFVGFLNVPLRVTDGQDTSNVLTMTINVETVIKIIMDGKDKKDDIAQIYFAPNPVKLGDGKIFFLIPSAVEAQWEITIYDNVGNVIDQASFVSDGGERYSWNLTNLAGALVGSGEYLAIIYCKLNDGTVRVFRRMIGVKL